MQCRWGRAPNLNFLDDFGGFAAKIIQKTLPNCHLKG
jgi:hypothetical protein